AAAWARRYSSRAARSAPLGMRGRSGPVMALQLCRRRVLAVEERELLVDLRIAPARLAPLLEERLGDHGEELGDVLGGVGIEPGLLAALERVAEALVGFRERGFPRAAVHADMQRRHAVGLAVQHVELVRELVQHHV